MFTRFSSKEMNEESKSKPFIECFNLSTKEEVVAQEQLIDLMQSIKSNPERN